MPSGQLRVEAEGLESARLASNNTTFVRRLCPLVFSMEEIFTRSVGGKKRKGTKRKASSSTDNSDGPQSEDDSLLDPVKQLA